MPKLPFENVDFAGMARNINDPGQPAPLPKERSTIAHDVMELAKTGIETYGKVKEKQIDDRRKAQINTINAISAASAIAGRGLRVSPGMFGDALTAQQTDEINRAAEERKKSEIRPEPLSVKKLTANPGTGLMEIFDTRTGERMPTNIPIADEAKPQKEPKVYQVKDPILGVSKFYTLDPVTKQNMIELVPKQKGGMQAVKEQVDAPAGMHFELDPITGEKTLVKD